MSVLVVFRSSGNLTSKLLEGLALGLGDKERGEDTAKHEQSEDLEDVVEPRGLVTGGLGTTDTERSNDNLGNDGTDLTGSGRKTVRSGAVAGREALSRDDEGGGIGTEVEEELAENVESKLAVSSNDVVTETENAEEDGEQSETHKLDRLAANGVNKGNSDPVTGDGTSADDDQVTDSGVVVSLVHVGTTTVADSRENDRVVERDTIESDIEEEPGASGTKENLAVLPLAVVTPEVGPRSLGNLELTGGGSLSGGTSDLIGVTVVLAVEVGLGVSVGLDNVTGNVEGVARSLGDGETVVESNASGNSTETNDDTPHLVNGELADTIASSRVLGSQKGLLEAGSDDKSNDTSGELTNTLHGEDGTHHGTAPLGGSELRGNDRRKRVVTTDTDTHENTPEDDDADDRDSGRVRGESLSDGCEDDDHEFETVHLLATDNIGEVTETDLTKNGTTGGSNLDGSVGSLGDLAGVLLSVLPVNDTKHVGDETNGENVVGIGEETNTGDDDGTNVVPAERSLVNFGKSESATLVRVFDVSKVIVEVVEGGVSTSGSVVGGHCYSEALPRLVEAMRVGKGEVR